jgi:glycosyltransferase involved in cell wall biosynthesis
VLLYRRSLALKSGAGQLMLMQASALEALGERVRIGGERGRLKFILGSRRLVRKLLPADARLVARAREQLVVDHELAIPEAAIAFVHNLARAGGELSSNEPLQSAAASDAQYFAELPKEIPIVANSNLVRNILISRFSLDSDRIAVHHPGFDSDRFQLSVREKLRPDARAALGVADGVPLVGLVTSGNLAKRGIDQFLEIAARIRSESKTARFLVVGSKKLPDVLAHHKMILDGTVLHRSRTSRPEQWFAALDLFLYPAPYEEFGMVVSEAQAMGVPIIASDQVGATECLPAVYDQWIVRTRDVNDFALKALALIEHPALARALVAEALESISRHDGRAYGAATAQAILAQKRRLK